MRFAFAGTPEFAARVLRDLEDRGRRPSLVISQPSRPFGRSRKLTAPPVVAEAARQGTPCLQTEDINSDDVVERLRKDAISTVVVAAFGQILKESLLDSLMCVNIHASLLPAYRGAAPIERALAAGEQVTGVTIMRVTERLDEGPWALQKAVSIGLHDDAGSLGRVLALLGAIGVDQVLTRISDGDVVWTEQGEGGSYACKVCAVECLLSTDRGAKTVHDQVRSLSPRVGARASTGDLEFKVWRTWPFGQEGLDPVPTAAAGVSGHPGRLAVVGERLFLGCAEGVVEILALQPAGKGEMTASAFLRGYKGRLGERLSEPGAPCAEGPE